MNNTLHTLATNICSQLYKPELFSTLGTIVDAYDGDDWKEHRLKTDNYIRSLVYEDIIFDIYVITWSQKFESHVHDHSKNGCWLKVLEGKLVETKYDQNMNEINCHELSEGSTSWMHNDIGYHKIYNSCDHETVTLHVYSPPGHKTKYFV